MAGRVHIKAKQHEPRSLRPDERSIASTFKETEASLNASTLSHDSE